MKDADIEILADYDSDKPRKKPKKKEKLWSPDLNPIQEKFFHDTTPTILLFGPKGSGKTVAAAHKMVRHLYEERNAFQLAIAPSIFTGREGIWHDLDQLVFPSWKEGIGLEFTESKLDPDTKDRHRWVGNRHGGWSKITMKSIPHAAFVEARIKGPAPSGIYVDEITNCNGREYYTFPAAQLMRRRNIEGPMQYIASCNPEGPSHWVYQAFIEEPTNKETNTIDPHFAVYHVPVTENVHRLPKGYVEHLDKLFKDPIQRRRLIDGEWIDMPTGQSIFKDHFFPEIHVRGDIKTGTGLKPIADFPVQVGHDPGPVNYSITFGQLLTVGDRVVWVVFDELNFVGQNKTFQFVGNRLMERIDFWNAKTSGKKLFCEHIGDEASFNQRRSNGSFDAQEIEKACKNTFRMKPCPKGANSIVSRVNMLRAYLLNESFYVSARCIKTIDMLTLMASRRPKPGEYDPNLPLTPIRNQHIHSFDSLTYPMWKYNTELRLVGRSEKITPKTYMAGGKTL